MTFLAFQTLVSGGRVQAAATRQQIVLLSHPVHIETSFVGTFLDIFSLSYQNSNLFFIVEVGWNDADTKAENLEVWKVKEREQGVMEWKQVLRNLFLCQLTEHFGRNCLSSDILLRFPHL